MDNNLKKDWKKLLENLEKLFGYPLEMQGVLFLIGVQELGAGPRKFSKQEKMDLIHIAICKLLSKWGYYELKGQDSEGWPFWEETSKLPYLKPGEQTRLLIKAVIEYFEDNSIAAA